jgi:transaldolase
MMNANQQLHQLGQRLWLDNISRTLVTDGTLERYIRDYAVSGLTSNPTIFEQAIKAGGAYDDAIRKQVEDGRAGEALFFELALEDLTRAADLLAPLHRASGGLDGWVSLEVSPLLLDDPAGTVMAARHLHAHAQRPNLFIKIPGNLAGLHAIEASVFAGVPVNVTLLFSREHYLAAADAYMCAIERRIAAGLDPAVASVASIFVSRWDTAVRDRVAAGFQNRLGIAIAMQTYKAYRELLRSTRWQKLATAGARPQRLLWASTGSKDPAVADTFYVNALAAPDTINTMPEKTLLAFAAHGEAGAVLPADGGYAEAVIAEFAREGIDTAALAAELQHDGGAAFARSWGELMRRIAAKSRASAVSATH